MANAGDTYTVELKASHLGWGTHRYTNTRPRIEGERYLPILRRDAIRLNIVNSNATGGRDVLGQNIFNCCSGDGFFRAVFKAQGCVREGDIYAKQFSVDNDLQALRTWYDHIGADVGTLVRVTWTSPTDIVIERI